MKLSLIATVHNIRRKAARMLQSRPRRHQKTTSQDGPTGTAANSRPRFTRGPARAAELKLSVIVITHNMRREAARTLHSLSGRYQQNVSEDDYKVIVIDNGSDLPLNANDVQAHGPNFRYQFFATDSISPVAAMNFGANLARGSALAFIVDGARMASPGLLARNLQALTLAPDPFVAALCWHLGPNIQNISMLSGYDQATEDSLLASIEWPRDGYRLFDVSTLASSSGCGFAGGMPPECSWLCLPRESFAALGGYEMRFQTGGGGLVNHDFRNRALKRDGVTPIVLLGEGLFHQFHGGVATNIPKASHPIETFKQEYAEIRGAEFQVPPCPGVTYIGAMPPPARPFLTKKRNGTKASE